MTNSLSDHAEENFLNHFFDNSSWSLPTPEVSLHTSDPGDTGANELDSTTYSSYSRHSVSFNSPTMVLGGNSYTTNNVDIVWPDATTDWPEISYLGLFNSDNNEFLWHGILDSPVTINENENLKIAAGDLRLEAG